MDVYTCLKKLVTFLGLGQKDDKISGRLWCYIVVQIVLTTNTAGFLVDRWHNLNDRVIGLRAMILFFLHLTYTAALTVNWREFSSMLELFGELEFKIPYPVSPRRKEIIDAMETKIRQLNRWWYRMAVTAEITTLTAPILIVMLKALLFSEDFQDLIKTTTSTPFPLYFPHCIKRFESQEWMLNTIVYFTGYTLHCTFMILTASWAQLIYVTSLGAILNVEFELKLLTLSLVEMDDVTYKPVSFDVETDYYGLKNRELHVFVRYLAQHHQQTYRKFEVANKGLRWTTFTFCTFTSVFFCTSIFTIVQTDQITVKIQEAVISSAWGYGIYFFDVFGERTKTEHDNLRNALYECSWQDKPEWFKRSLLIMMIRTYKPIDIKPFGMFSLNLNSFAATLNAAYCYYNVLCKFNKKS